MGVALRGVALKRSVPHLPISAIYGPISMKITPFNHKFLIDYIFFILESATPLLGGVAPRGVAENKVKKLASHFLLLLNN